MKKRRGLHLIAFACLTLARGVLLLTKVRNGP
jgi:hypothetical protein